MLAIDLDHFKDINDTLGHHIGDELIGVVAQRLVHAVRREDLVARLGGDEFAVIMTEVADLEALERFADRLIAVLRAPYSISGHTLVIGASIGIAVIDRNAGDAADIMRRADVALYRAKNEGRSRACIYDADMDADLRERKQLENDLRAAIAEDGLSVAYQPIMNASGEKMAGVEALCRWKHPTRGAVPPAEFIPIAERSELIIPLGEWVLRKACIEAKPWTGLTVAVNVSPLQFRRQDFVEVVERILAETGFDPQRLELELTESTLLGNVDDAEKAMHRLKAHGVRFALDDFGTGYSSLLYLRRFPFDRIKIDRSFVRSIETAADAASIVHAIVSLGRGLGMKVTAEGVENRRAATVPARRRRALDAGLPLRQAAPAQAIAERLAPGAQSRRCRSRRVNRTCAPERCTTSCHFAESFAIIAANSSGVPPAGSSPIAAKALLEGRRLDRAVDRRVELVEDRPRNAGGPDHAAPGRRRVAGHAGLRDGRQIGKAGRAPLAGDRERPHRAGARMRRDRVQALEHQLHAPGDQVVDRRRAAAIRDVHDLGAAHVFEQLAADMAGRAVAGRGVRELAGIFLRVVDQFRRPS